MNKSKTSEREGEESDIIRLTSPISVKSRLAPLEVPLNKASVKKDTTKTNKNIKATTSSNKIINTDGFALQTSVKEDEQQLETNWKMHIEPLVNSINLCLEDNKIDQFCENCDKLNKLLEQNQMFSKTCIKRSSILKQIFKYLDTDCDRVKIHVSKIILNVS